MEKTMENIPEMLIGEIGACLKGMIHSGSMEEKLAYSRIIYNLSHSLGAFVDFIEEVLEEEDFEEDESLSD